MLKKLRQKKAIRVYLRQMFNITISAGVSYATYLSGLEWESSALIGALLIPVLNIITKFINVSYFGDLGVEKNK